MDLTEFNWNQLITELKEWQKVADLDAELNAQSSTEDTEKLIRDAA